MVYSILVNPVEDAASLFLAIWEAIPIPFKFIIYLSFGLCVLLALCRWLLS